MMGSLLRPLMFPLPGPVDGIVSMAGIPLHFLPVLHHHHPLGMYGFPGMSYPGKDSHMPTPPVQLLPVELKLEGLPVPKAQGLELTSQSCA